MPFPDSPRVVYRRNSLEEVICQVKFPPILKIDAELPSQFQDDIRADYPLLEEAPAIAANIPAEFVKMIPSLAGTTSYIFESGDHAWKVTLNREFLSLSTTDYKRWEQFSERLNKIVGSLQRLYRPSFFVRVGLRYRNTIKRSALDLGNVDWSELLQPWILGELSVPAVAPHIQQAVRDILLSLEHDGAQLRLRHGIVPIPGQESSYSIDGDFFKEKRTEIDHAIGLLNAFNKEAGRLFSWCIKPRLRERLDPQPIAGSQ
jgi:uncharacterized protein (TIGR04255 family)